jgi:alpha-D-xyloside xylohydrolase
VAGAYVDETLGWYRIYTRLHLRLFPHEWTLAENLAKDGRPMPRALGLAYPELGVHPNDEYRFGDDLLVAPVLERDARSRSVVFPPDRESGSTGGPARRTRAARRRPWTRRSTSSRST